MTRNLCKFIASGALALATVGAQAAVLTFEDMLPFPTGEHFFVADYKGFKFGTNSVATNHWFYTDEVTPFYTPKSPTHFIATSGSPLFPFTGAPLEAAQSITSAVDFIFDGAWFSGFGQIQFKLYNNGILVHTSAVSGSLNDSTPIAVNSGYTGLVDELVVLGQQTFFAMDDFTFNTGRNLVPEPTSLALVLLAGAVGVGAARRRSAAVVSA